MIRDKVSHIDELDKDCPLLGEEFTYIINTSWLEDGDTKSSVLRGRDEFSKTLELAIPTTVHQF